MDIAIIFDVKNEKISAPVLENSENRCLLKESAQKRAGTGGRIAQSVEQGTENPRVPSSILGPATILFAFIRGFPLKQLPNDGSSRSKYNEEIPFLRSDKVSIRYR